MNKDYIELGLCSSPHGIKGAFTFKLYSDESVLKNGDKVFLVPSSNKSNIEQDGKFFKIKSISFGNKVICYLDGIDDRNICESLLPFKIFYSRSLFPVIENSDEFYISDLIGLSAYDESGLKLGVIKESYDNSAQIIIVIKGSEVIEIPFIEQFVKEVNIKDGKIIISPPVLI